MFTYCHANTPLSQSERANHRSYSIMVDGTDWNNLISELVTLKATLALPLDLALPIAK